MTSVSRKPLSISLEEIAAGKITYVRTNLGETGEDVDEAAGDALAVADQAPVGPDAADGTRAATTLQAAPEPDVVAEAALDTAPGVELEAEAAGARARRRVWS